MIVKLQIKDDTGKTHSVPLTRDEITIGRKEGNTIRLTERNVSRTHARFLRKGEEIHVEDLSRYGTRVNGERITETRRVGSGDVIQIGDYLISLEGVKPVDENAVADQKLAAAGAAAAAPAAATAPAAAKPAKDAKPADKDAKGKPSIPDGYAMKTMPEGSVSAEEVRKSLGAGKKRIGANHQTLVAVTTSLAGQEFPITAATMILGRTGENDLKVDHQSISSNHAKVVVADGRVKMVDLKSKNGIRVNGEYWEESTLKSGDVIELGKVQFRFVDKGEEFVYRPEDWANGAKPGAKAALAPVVEEKKSKAWLVILLLVLAGGAVAAYFATRPKDNTGGQVVNNPTKPTEPTKATEPTATTTTAAVTNELAADAGASATQAADTQQAAVSMEADTATAPEVVDQNATAKADLLKKAQDAAKAMKWDDAKAALDGLLTLDPENTDGKALLAMVTAEKSAGAVFEEYQAAQAKNDLPAAWAALGKLDSLDPSSGYYARYQEAKAAVGPALANWYADQAQSAYNRKAWNEAIARAEDAKKITFNHARADEIIAKAKKKQREEKEANPTNPTNPTNPPPTGKTGADLYKDARALHNSDPQGALKLYEQAAAKGYPAAYKQIGSIKVKLGDTGGAVAAYKRYLSLNPTANDADMVKDIIVRLGGTP